MKRVLIKRNFDYSLRASIELEFTPEVCLQILGGNHPVCKVTNGSFGPTLEFIGRDQDGAFMLTWAENSFEYAIDYDHILRTALQLPYNMVDEQTRHFSSKFAVFSDGTKVLLTEKILTRLPSIASEQWRAGREYIASLD